MNELSQLSDSEIVKGIVANNPQIIEYFFIKKCSNLFMYIVSSVFDGKVEREELINELFLYLAGDNWRKLREFNYKSTLITWVSVVATRFFLKKRDKLIEKDSSEALIIENENNNLNSISEDSINIRMAIEKMPNERYKRAIQLLDLQECSYENVATKLNVTVANLYNIHRRAIAQLSYILIV